MDVVVKKPGDQEDKPPEDWKLGEFVDAQGRKFKSFVRGIYRLKPSKYTPGKSKSVKGQPWCFVDYVPKPREDLYACQSCMWRFRCGSKF